jgi:hypothetical protein
MAVNLTINTGKGIKITTGAGGIFYIRNGNLKNFYSDKVGKQYYFNYQAGSDLKFDYCLKYSDIGTYTNGAVTTIPSYDALAQAILTELDAEF